MAGARVADHKHIAVWMVPTIASPTLAPTAAELAAGINVTCDIEKGSNILTFTGDQTSTASGSLCEDVQIETWTGSVFGGDMTYFRRFTAGAPAVDDVTKTLPEPGEYVYVVVREGYAYDLAVAAAQVVDVFYCQAGTMQKIRGTGENTLRVKQNYLQAGAARADIAVLA